MFSVFLVTFGTVFAAEIVGDKLLYTTGVLAARYRALPIVAGATLAFMIKMAAAVLVGKAIAGLPPLLVAAVTTVSFLWVAYTVWRKPDDTVPSSRPVGISSKGAVMSFVAVLGSEWGDIGQITAATMAARFGSPWLVWLGAVCAMVTKGALAAWLGTGVRRWVRDRVSPRMLRYGSVALLAMLGALSAGEVLIER